MKDNLSSLLMGLDARRCITSLLIMLFVAFSPVAHSDPFGDLRVIPGKSCTLVGQVTLDGEAGAKWDVVAVYVGDQLRGKHEIVHVVEGVAYITLVVQVENAKEKTTEFRVWDVSEDRVHALDMMLELGDETGKIKDSIGLENPVGLDFETAKVEPEPSIVLLSASSVNDTYVRFEEYELEEEAGRITVAPEGSVRFYRLKSSGSKPPKIIHIQVEEARLVIHFE